MKNILYGIWLALGLGLLMTCGVLWVVSPEYSQFIFGVFIASVLILLSLAHVKKKVLKRFFGSRFFKNLSSNLFTIFLAASILGIINYLAFKNNYHLDMTKQKVHTLSEQSKSILKDIDSPIKMTLFARRQNWDRFLNLLNLYKYENEMVQVKVIDVDSNPSLVQLNNVKEDGTVVIEYKGKKVSVVAKNELKITNQLIKLLRSGDINIYYTIGHGEINRNIKNQNGGSYLYSKLTGSNYHLRPLDLLKTMDIPKNAHLVMILGPKEGFLELEMAQIKRYLKRGGNLLVTLGPEFGDIKLANFYKLLQDNGIKFNNSIVLDRLSTVQGSQATIPIVTTFNPDHSITKSFNGKVLLPLSGMLSEQPKEYIDYTALTKSNNFPGSWAETNFKEVNSGRATYDKKDFKGPIDLVSTIENTKTTSRVIVSSSSSFIVNGYQSQSTNFNFFLNMVAWGVNDEGIISLNRPELSNEMIILSASQTTLIFYFAIAFFPFLLFAMAFLFYRRRLKK